MHQVDPKDGYSVNDCRVDRNRRLFEFLIPIVHPDKPTRVTITIGNTIFGALDGGREVDWGVIFRDMIQRLAKGVGKPKPTPFVPFCSISTRAKVCSQQKKNWTTGRPRKWPDTGSPRIRTRNPDQTRTNRLQPQRPLRDLGHRERPPRGGSPRTRLLPDRHQSGPGDHQVRFHRHRSQGSSNWRIDRRKDKSG